MPYPRLPAEKFLSKPELLLIHAGEELGLPEIHAAHAIQAVVASVVTFAVGAALPLIMVLLSSYGR